MATKRKTQNSSAGQVSLFQATEVPEPFRKAVQVVHSKPHVQMSLMERKISNSWIKNALDRKPDEEGWWYISVSHMGEQIGFDSNNVGYLKEVSRRVMSIRFEWDVLAKEGKGIGWKASVLFPEVEIRGDHIRYQVSRQLREQLLNPTMYAMLDMAVVRKFKRAPALGLYEHCIRFENIGQTARIHWTQLRDILLGEGTDSKSYQDFKYFNAKVVKPAVAEINAVTDFQLEAHTARMGRTVTEIWFTIVKIVQKDAAENIDSAEELAAVGELIKIGMPQSEAKRLVRQHGVNSVTAALAYTERRANDKKQTTLGNKAAYFRAALTQKWGVIDELTQPEVAAKAPPKPKAKSLQEALKDKRSKDAEEYFKELDPADQAEFITKYNHSQEISGLRIKNNKVQKGAQTAFFRWLGQEVWGEPTQEEALQFATEMIAARGLL
ncbi:replication initiation protein [Curvibacter sp. APW13]|uniref:replication initiation protein n=1 Tax=Curvibacter sp. APW13 TaxID=3077236 RepID=UPI0028E08452|nr:replication initiation protein [Curvibacter sp. APW13]MDT8992837.1 replication initiation protein [Curvibacter sp. APW13]